MFFRQILHEEKSCLSYMIGCPTKAVCAVIDAQGDAQQYVDIAKNHGLTITHVIETHIQADHLSASPHLGQILNVPVYFGPGANVDFPSKNLADGDVIEIGRRKIKAIHTPGHTPEHICLMVDDWFVITGDTLFVGDVGRVDLAMADVSRAELEAKAGDLYDSVQKLMQLPDYFEIYPGHYRGSACGKGMDSKPISTIGRERRKNPVLKLSKHDFIKYLFEDMPKPPPNFKQIKEQNCTLN